MITPEEIAKLRQLYDDPEADPEVCLEMMDAAFPLLLGAYEVQARVVEAARLTDAGCSRCSDDERWHTLGEGCALCNFECREFRPHTVLRRALAALDQEASDA